MYGMYLLCMECICYMVKSIKTTKLGIHVLIHPKVLGTVDNCFRIQHSDLQMYIFAENNFQNGENIQIDCLCVQRVNQNFSKIF